MNRTRSCRAQNWRLRALLAASVLLAMLAGAAPAASAEEAPAAPHWKLESRPAPTNLPLEREGVAGEGVIVVTASNLGDADVNGEESVTITDTLPGGLEAVQITADSAGTGRSEENVRSENPKTKEVKNPNGFSCSKPPATAIVCTFGQKLPPYEQLEILIRVRVTLTAAAQLENKVTVTGGGAEPETLDRPVAVNDEPAMFGLEDFEVTPETDDGALEAQAGAHPFQLTTTFTLNETDEVDGERLLPAAPALSRNLSIKLPPGLIGDPNAVPQCGGVDFGALDEDDINSCPNETVVGVAAVTVNDPVPLHFTTELVPVFNLVPAPGEPARFGFEAVHVPVVLDTSVRTGGDYGVTLSVHNASEAVQVLGTRVTIWGAPDDARHDQSRGWSCLFQGTESERLHEPCKPLELPRLPPPFLTLPTTCGPLDTSVEDEAWNAGELEQQGQASSFRGSSEEPPALTGCQQLPFEPSIAARPDEHAASTPTGLTVEVNLPQSTTLTDGELAEADVKTTTVTLPEGVQANAGAAGGLEACSALQVGFDGTGEEGTQLENDHFSTVPPVCPNASKIGEVEIDTPLLSNPLSGSVYLAEQDTNPFRSPLVIYVVAEEPTSRVLVKLAGEVRIDETTGQLVSTFNDTPPLPFEHLKLRLFNSERPVQATPAFCGSDYQAAAVFTPSSQAPSVKLESNPGEFEITEGPGGSPCPLHTLPFTPSFQASPTNSQSDAFTPFSLTIGRADGQQALESVTVHLPPGIAALISQVTPCPEQTALMKACGPESLVGHTTSVAGLGDEPITLGGALYLTGPLKATSRHGAAPFGLLAVTPAVAGPFNLGDVSVLSTLEVDDHTAAVTVQSEPIPKMLKGVPVQLKELNVTVERPEGKPFEFNPTSCEPTTIAGALTGYEGTSVARSWPFRASNCADLAFEPKLTAVAGGQGSKADGTSLDIKIESPGLGHEANIAKVDLQLPAALSSRLSTLQQACPEAVFDANPAACDEGSVIGSATVDTPVLKALLTGPGYLVSRGAEYPDVEFVLSGEGITLVLDGKTQIKAGITYSKFESAPDAPFTTFEADLPAGPHSALTPNVPERERFSLCKASLLMPTTITGQNGSVIEQTTRVAVSGCGGVLRSQSKKLTRAQLLAKALKSCRKDRKRSKRVVCERQARKRFAKKAPRGRASAGKHARSR